MNKKIKMIELLNKMNNQEELPRKIQYGYDNNNCPAIWRLMVGSRDYWCSERDTMDNYLFRDYIGDITAVLDNEVEILEDNTEEIEELYIDTHKILSYDREESKGATVTCFKLIIDEINRLKVAINQLRKDKSND